MAYGDHNNPVYSSTNRLAEPDKTDKVSNTMLIVDRDQSVLSQNRAQIGYSKKNDKLSETKVIRKRKDRGPISDPQTGYVNNRSGGEDSNPYKLAKISSVVKKPRENIEKVYHRKNNKRPLGSRPNTGDLKSKSDNEEDKLERLSLTMEGKIVEPGKSASYDITTGKYIDPEKAWCMTILKKYGVGGQFSETPSYAKHPGVVGDGTCHRTCKTCNGLEDARSLICDMCEESFHMSCCKPKVKSKPVQDWICQTCKTKRKKKGIKVSTNCEIESKYSYLLREMLNDNTSFTTQVRIGKEYQADIPECTGKLSDSSVNPFTGVVVSHKEKILEKELAEENLKNNIWVKYWKPANALPPGSKERWLQCMSTTYKKGEVCSDGRKAKTDIICGKWRRAPLSEVQTEKWDCSCAVVWDPHHADCFVPQELETSEIQRRMEECKQELETSEIVRRTDKCEQELETFEIGRCTDKYDQELETSEIEKHMDKC